MESLKNGMQQLQCKLLIMTNSLHSQIAHYRNEDGAAKNVMKTLGMLETMEVMVIGGRQLILLKK